MEDDANEFGGWVLVLILVGVLVAGGIVAALRADADSPGARRARRRVLPHTLRRRRPLPRVVPPAT
jgi:hypothetical protein